MEYKDNKSQQEPKQKRKLLQTPKEIEVFKIITLAIKEKRLRKEAEI